MDWPCHRSFSDFSCRLSTRLGSLRPRLASCIPMTSHASRPQSSTPSDYPDSAHAIWLRNARADLGSRYRLRWGVICHAKERRVIGTWRNQWLGGPAVVLLARFVADWLLLPTAPGHNRPWTCSYPCRLARAGRAPELCESAQGRVLSGEERTASNGARNDAP